MRTLTTQELELVSGGTTVAPVTITASGGSGWTTYYPDPTWGMSSTPDGGLPGDTATIGDGDECGWRGTLGQWIIDLLGNVLGTMIGNELTPTNETPQQKAERVENITAGTNPANWTTDALPGGGYLFTDTTTGIGYVDTDPAAGNGIDYRIQTTLDGGALLVDNGDGQGWRVAPSGHP